MESLKFLHKICRRVNDVDRVTWRRPRYKDKRAWEMAKGRSGEKLESVVIVKKGTTASDSIKSPVSMNTERDEKEDLIYRKRSKKFEDFDWVLQ